jgi:hypothetical protein
LVTGVAEIITFNCADAGEQGDIPVVVRVSIAVPV